MKTEALVRLALIETDDEIRKSVESTIKIIREEENYQLNGLILLAVAHYAKIIGLSFEEICLLIDMTKRKLKK